MANTNSRKIVEIVSKDNNNTKAYINIDCIIDRVCKNGSAMSGDFKSDSSMTVLEIKDRLRMFKAIVEKLYTSSGINDIIDETVEQMHNSFGRNTATVLLSYGIYKEYIDIYLQELIYNTIIKKIKLKAREKVTMTDILRERTKDKTGNIERREIDISICKELTVLNVVENKAKEYKAEYEAVRSTYTQVAQQTSQGLDRSGKNTILKYSLKYLIYEDVMFLKGLVDKIDDKELMDRIRSKLKAKGKKQNKTQMLGLLIDDYLYLSEFISESMDNKDNKETTVYDPDNLPSSKFIAKYAKNNSRQVRNISIRFNQVKLEFKRDVCKDYLKNIHMRFTDSIMTSLQPVIDIIANIDECLRDIDRHVAGTLTGATAETQTEVQAETQTEVQAETQTEVQAETQTEVSNWSTNENNREVVSKLEGYFRTLNKTFIPLQLFFEDEDKIAEDLYINIQMKTNGVESNPMPDDWINGMSLLQLIYSSIQNFLADEGILKIVLKILDLEQESEDLMHKDIDELLKYRLIYDNPRIIIRVYDVQRNGIPKYSVLNADMSFFYHVIKWYTGASDFSEKLHNSKGRQKQQESSILYLLIDAYKSYMGDLLVDASQVDITDTAPTTSTTSTGSYIDVFTSVINLRSIFERQPGLVSGRSAGRDLGALVNSKITGDQRHRNPALFTTRFTTRNIDILSSARSAGILKSPTVIDNEMLSIGRLHDVSVVDAVDPNLKDYNDDENKNTQSQSNIDSRGNKSKQAVVLMDVVFQDIVSNMDKNNNDNILQVETFRIKISSLLGLRCLIKDPNILDKKFSYETPFNRLTSDIGFDELSMNIYSNYNKILKGCLLFEVYGNRITDASHTKDYMTDEKFKTSFARLIGYNLFENSNLISTFLTDEYIDFYYDLIDLSLDATFIMKFSNTYQTAHYLSDDTDVLTGGSHYRGIGFEPVASVLKI